MSIERALYSAVPLGVEKDDAGLQYYTYTKGFLKLAEKDTTGTISGLSMASYVAPNGNECFCNVAEETDLSDHTSQDYSVSLPTTLAEKNDIEKKAAFYHPYSFSYRTINVGEESKAMFIFGKELGMDWSGGRPKAPYIYTVVCEESDVCKAPVFYCSSPAVSCNIYRNALFPENGTPTKPDFFRYISSLDDDDDIASLPYEAGFNDISKTEIINFIKEENNIDILISMFSALIAYKEGDKSCRLIIADERRNILLWIASLSVLFPEKMAKEMSFSSYLYAPKDFDINGVFVPSLNKCFKDSGSGYNLSSVDQAYAVYDFSEEHYAPRVKIIDNIFVNMIKSAYAINFTPLEKYKRFIAEHTTYSNISFDYIYGYDLFAYKSGMVKYDLEKAFMFAEKYLEKAELKSLLNRVLSDYKVLCKNNEHMVLLRSFIEHCGENNINPIKESENVLIDSLISDFLHDDNDDELKVNLDLCARLCKLSNDDICYRFIERIDKSLLLHFVNATGSLYRKLYINRAICIYADRNDIVIEPNSVFGDIIRSLLLGIIKEDSPQNGLKVKSYLEENLKLLKNSTSKVVLCDIVFSMFHEKSYVECANNSLNIAAGIYINGDSLERGKFFSGLTKSKYAADYVKFLIDNIKKDTNIVNVIHAFFDLYKYGGKLVAPYADYSKKVVLSLVKDSLNNANNRSAEVYYEAFGFLKMLSSTYSVKTTTDEMQIVLDSLFDEVMTIAPDLVLDSKYIEMIENASSYARSISCLRCYEEFIIAFKSLEKIKIDINNTKPGSSFRIEKKCPYNPLDLSMLPPEYRDTYIKTLGLFCGEHWSLTGVLPNYLKMVGENTSDEYYEYIFQYMFRKALKNIKNTDRCAADIIEYSIIMKYSTVLEDIPKWLEQCDVKKGVIDCLEKDVKIKVELKKVPKERADLLNQVDTLELQKYSEIVKEYYASSKSGGLGNFFSSFGKMINQKKGKK